VFLISLVEAVAASGLLLPYQDLVTATAPGSDWRPPTVPDMQRNIPNLVVQSGGDFRKLRKHFGKISSLGEASTSCVKEKIITTKASHA